MTFIKETGHPGEKHIRAQYEIATLLKKYYEDVAIEQEAPVPMPYLKYNPQTHDIIPYKFDVYAASPKNPLICEYFQVGIEIYGDVGHKHTRRQYKRDEHRNNALKHYYGVHVQSYDTDDIVGMGQPIKGTIRKYKPLILEDMILKDLKIVVQT